MMIPDLFPDPLIPDPLPDPLIPDPLPLHVWQQSFLQAGLDEQCDLNALHVIWYLSLQLSSTI